MKWYMIEPQRENTMISAMVTAQRAAKRNIGIMRGSIYLHRRHSTFGEIFGLFHFSDELEMISASRNLGRYVRSKDAPKVE